MPRRRKPAAEPKNPLAAVAAERNRRRIVASNKKRAKEAVKAADDFAKENGLRREPGAMSRFKMGAGKLCDGRKKDGSPCNYAAGWGTKHPGIGNCKWHGGADPRAERYEHTTAKGTTPRKPKEPRTKKGTFGFVRQQPNEPTAQELTPPKTRAQKISERKKKLARRRKQKLPYSDPRADRNPPKTMQDAQKLLGVPIDMDPMQALLWCIRITAGEVVWYSERLQELEEHDWIEQSIAGKQLHLFARQRVIAIDRLAKYSKWAVDSGIAERAVKLAETYGEQLARILSGVLEDLALSHTQKAIAPGVIRKHLYMLEEKNVSTDPHLLIGGADPDDPDVIVVTNPAPAKKKTA